MPISTRWPHGPVDVGPSGDVQPTRVAAALPPGRNTLLAGEVRGHGERRAHLRAPGIQKTYDRGHGKQLRVLEDIDLEIRSNEVVCLIGPPAAASPRSSGSAPADRGDLG